jgi:hypothetical protein
MTRKDMTEMTQADRLTDEQYNAILSELARWDDELAESQRLQSEGTLEKAALLDRLRAGEQWVVERNAERAVKAKTPLGGRPIDPTSRNQFAEWLEGRYHNITKTFTYRLFDAFEIKQRFFRHGEKTPPGSEAQLRPLKTWTKPLYGDGVHIPEIWEIACRIASDNGYREPTQQDVKDAGSEWKRLHLPSGQARKLSTKEKARSRRTKALAAWHQLMETGIAEEINAFLAVVESDMEQLVTQ